MPQGMADSVVAELIHDVRNTLGAVALLSEVLMLELQKESTAHNIADDVRLACQQAQSQCRQVMEALNGSKQQAELTDLSQLVDAMSPVLTTCIPRASVLQFNLSNDLPLLELVPDDIRRVLLNLVKNAGNALGDRPGIVTVSTGKCDLEEDGSAANDDSSANRSFSHPCLVVSDTGCGFDMQQRIRFMEQPLKSKPDGRGLGLASVERIVESHGARLTFTSCIEAGTTARVVFAECEPAGLTPPPNRAELNRATDDVGNPQLLPYSGYIVDHHSDEIRTPYRFDGGDVLIPAHWGLV